MSLPSHLCWELHMLSTERALMRKWRQVKTFEVKRQQTFQRSWKQEFSSRAEAEKIKHDDWLQSLLLQFLLWQVKADFRSVDFWRKNSKCKHHLWVSNRMSWIITAANADSHCCTTLAPLWCGSAHQSLQMSCRSFFFHLCVTPLDLNSPPADLQ